MSAWFRAIGLVLRCAWRADRRLTIVAFAVGMAEQLSTPVIALSARAFANAAAHLDVGRSLATAIVLTAAVGAGPAVYRSAVSLRVLLRDLTIHQLDRRLMELNGGSTGILHQEAPEYQDRLQLVRTQVRHFGNISAFISLLAVAVNLVVTTAILLSLDFALVLLPIAALLVVLGNHRQQHVVEAAEAERAPDRRLAARLFSLATETTSADEVLAYRLEHELTARLRDAEGRSVARGVRAQWRGTIWAGAGRLVFGLTMAGCVVLVAGRAAFGLLSAGDVLMLLYLAQSINTQVRTGVGHLANLNRAVRSGLVYLSLQKQLRPTPRAAALRTPADGGGSGPRPPAGLVVEDLGFTYPGQETPALRGISFSLPAGATVAIVGDNGAGKSTLVKLLCGLYTPTAGRVLVDGVDLADLDPDEWRGQLTCCFQDFVRFQLVARESIGLGDLGAIDDPPAVARAMERAGAAALGEDLPDGLETQLGAGWSGGVELSVGQWQKVALSRSLMRMGPRVVLLDEPTASLDSDAEYHLFRTFAEACRRARRRGAITVVVSHRFSTVRTADTILVLRRGGLVEFGSHDELLARADGLYQRLYSMQASKYAS